jgi:hypothetical protein
MTDAIKSGHEILDDFFYKIDEIEGVNGELALLLKNLYQQGKLTHTNLSNELLKIREIKLRGKD